MSRGATLRIHDLAVQIGRPSNAVHALRGLTLSLQPGKVTGLIGESGSGKTMTALSIIGILPEQARVTSGEILFDGNDLLQLAEPERKALRGKQLGIIFQNARAALNPLFSVGRQIADVYKYHEKVSGKVAWNKAVEMLDAMGIPDARHKANSYPHEFSGGMCQRVMIAMALVCSPRLLIADEPTTGLDVTIQAQVLEVITKMVEELGATLLYISHDLGVIAEISDTIVVMYAGQIVEQGTVEQVLDRPAHPYTRGLIESFEMDEGERMHYIPGRVPDLRTIEGGRCAYTERCSLHPYLSEEQQLRCIEETPLMIEVESGHLAACHYAENHVALMRETDS